MKKIKPMLDEKKRNWLLKILGKNICFDESMSRHTSFRVGGPAEAYITPPDTETLSKILGWADEKKLPFYLVGGGTNLLVKDKGIGGLVISLKKLNKIDIFHQDKTRVYIRAQAGVSLAKLCRFAINNNLTGMNFGLGIPGTIGGALMMNAGTALGQMSDVVKSIQIMRPDGRIQIFERKNLHFEYRRFIWKNDAPIILGADFMLLSSQNPDQLTHEAQLLLEKRKKSQPTRLPSAGCFFKNPQKGPGAGALIDQAGLKGFCIGGAKVSECHANFIVNDNHASGADILALADIIQKVVFENFGIQLEREVWVFGS